MVRLTPAPLRRVRGEGKHCRIGLLPLILGTLLLSLLMYISAFWAVMKYVGPGEKNADPLGGLRAPLSARQPQQQNLELAQQSLQGTRKEKEQQQKLVQQIPEKVSVNISNNLQKAPARVTVGFAVTITGCGSDPITEGAAVLKHSIHLASVHGPLGGRYDYKMYAIYHPDGESCAMSLKDLGFELVRRETPVAVADIQGDFLRENIVKNGCCGEKELVKLEAYTLIQHPIIVHLDLDVLVLKPMDALFDWMMHDSSDSYDASDVPIMWKDNPRPQKVNAFFTRDYNMVGPGRKYKPVQGGFLVLRPDMDSYQEYVDIVRKGDFRQKGGWGGIVGPFYGSMTFQGIVPYFYDILHPTEAVELNRCVYNQMCDNPKDKRTVNDIPQGRCRTNEEECEDCRNRALEDVVTSHFTLCQKPWLCLPQDSDIIQQRLCRKLHHEWHRIRADLEESWGRSKIGDGTFQPEHFYGHCNSLGKHGYIPIATPYGNSVASK